MWVWSRGAQATCSLFPITPEISLGVLLDKIWVLLYIKFYDPFIILLYFSHDSNCFRNVFVTKEEHDRSHVETRPSTAGGSADVQSMGLTKDGRLVR